VFGIIRPRGAAELVVPVPFWDDGVQQAGVSWRVACCVSSAVSVPFSAEIILVACVGKVGLTVGLRGAGVCSRCRSTAVLRPCVVALFSRQGRRSSPALLSLLLLLVLLLLSCRGFVLPSRSGGEITAT
jgi:hypothetical protein